MRYLDNPAGALRALNGLAGVEQRSAEGGKEGFNCVGKELKMDCADASARYIEGTDASGYCSSVVTAARGPRPRGYGGVLWDTCKQSCMGAWALCVGADDTPPARQDRDHGQGSGTFRA